jgi:3-methyl-2-oxobutanoate hydroxymethyltransferase
VHVKTTLPQLRDKKLSGEPIVMVTAYDYPSGRAVDDAGVDLVLVGDSAARAVLGHASEIPVTMDEMVVLTRAVTRGATGPLVVADLPFMSYQVSVEDAVRNAGRFVKEAGADAVKLEGAGPSLARIRALSSTGIATMAHIGLTPQSATALGGMRAQGRTWAEAKRLYDEALAVEDAGAFAVVLECVPAAVAERISRRLTIPTIGIGSGPGTDGQVLVLHDLLGITEGLRPRFVKRYAELGAAMREAVAAYASEVRERSYPGPEHTYAISPEDLSAFDTAVEASPRIDTNALADW